MSLSAENHHLTNSFNSKKGEHPAIADFIDNVLRQIPSEKIIDLVATIKTEHAQTSDEPLTDAQLYIRLYEKLVPLRSKLDIIKKIKLIQFQKALLAKQIKKLLGSTKTIKNCLEIGTPGTYASTISNSITGKIYTLGYKQSATDILQAHSLNPMRGFKGYHEYIPLNDYLPVSEQIPDNSIDLIICTIGLHHCPPEKLDAFIASLHRILRPGGVFLLREHDARSPELVAIASSAHSIFNAIIPEETLEDEVKEVRNFQALSYWKKLLARHGFHAHDLELLQKGDSTLNTFTKFTKLPVTAAEQEASASFQALQTKDYARDGVQTYLTTPEWNNVDAAQHYGQFINKIPFYEFPYTAHTKTFWKTFINSWRCAAKEKGGNLKLLMDSNIMFNYTLMNLFIGTFMTIENGIKSIISWPIRKMLSGVEATKLMALVRDPHNTVTTIDPAITVKDQYEGDLKLICVPRYIEFLPSVKKLLSHGITFVKIANNDRILCKVRYKKENMPSVQTHWELKFSWTMPTIPNYIYAAYLVPVKELGAFIKTFETSTSELLYIHDF